MLAVDTLQREDAAIVALLLTAVAASADFSSNQKTQDLGFKLSFRIAFISRLTCGGTAGGGFRASARLLRYVKFC